MRATARSREARALPEADRWDAIYAEHGPEGVSWAQRVPRESLDAIATVDPPRDAAILDLGGGASDLAGNLIDLGYQDVTVLDVSATALRLAAKRLGDRAGEVKRVHADVRSWEPKVRYDIWHDRAVFHFMVSEEDRNRYRRALRAGLSPGGHMIVQAFALDGPDQCSGRQVCRYDPFRLRDALGGQLTLNAYGWSRHLTPNDSPQEFVWVLLRDRR